jgi:hypothetical protein
MAWLCKAGIRSSVSMETPKGPFDAQRRLPRQCRLAVDKVRQRRSAYPKNGGRSAGAVCPSRAVFTAFYRFQRAGARYIRHPLSFERDSEGALRDRGHVCDARHRCAGVDNAMGGGERTRLAGRARGAKRGTRLESVPIIE